MARVRLVVRRNGPLILFADGKPKAILCRCGASKRKPYCDGSRARIGFKADEAVIREGVASLGRGPADAGE